MYCSEAETSASRAPRRAAKLKARKAAALQALREAQAQQQALQAAREVMSAEAAAAVAVKANGARTLFEALAEFGVVVVPGESETAAFRRAALRFHPDRQRAALEACGDDVTARLRVECTAAETFKLLSKLHSY